MLVIVTGGEVTAVEVAGDQYIQNENHGYQTGINLKTGETFLGKYKFLFIDMILKDSNSSMCVFCGKLFRCNQK